MTTLVFLVAVLSLVHAQIPGYTMVWNDEFNGPTLDRSKWKNAIDCWGGGNEEKQCYVDSQDTLYFQNGHMYMRANYHPNGHKGSSVGCTIDNPVFKHTCEWMQPVTSSRISTKGLHSWRYGRFESRMKVPSGNFLWPAFWMLPAHDVYGTWAASGEIDIMESKGQVPNLIYHTLHHGGNWPHNVYTSKEVIHPQRLTDDFHTYAVDWKEHEMRFYIDGVETHYLNLRRSWASPTGPNPYTRDGQPWDQEFYLIFNLAVSGNFFGEERHKFNVAQDSTGWQPFIVDYVRVYRHNTVPTIPPPVTLPSIPIADSEYEPIWHDHFDGNSLNPNNWRFDVDCFGGGNGQRQCYVDDGSVLTVSNGILSIKPVFHAGGYTGRADKCTSADRASCTHTKTVTSASIHTKQRAQFLYGKFDIRAQLPSGNLLWPTFQLLPASDTYGAWAASGEIDILDAKGNNPRQIHQTIWHGGNWPNQVSTSHTHNSPVDLSQGFHTFTLKWSPSKLEWLINGQLTHTVNLNRNFWSQKGVNPYTKNGQPFDQPFYIGMKLAVGGALFSAEENNRFNVQDSNTWKPLLIDSIVISRAKNGAQAVSEEQTKPSTAPNTTNAVPIAMVVVLSVLLVVVITSLTVLIVRLRNRVQAPERP